MKIVWWAKRDLRLGDNAALTAAVELARSCGGQVLPLFCHEPALIHAPDIAPMHTHAWCQALGNLRRHLRKRGADIFIADDDVVPTLDYVRMFYPFTHIFAHEEIGQKVTYDRDLAVAKWCRERGITYREFPQSSVQRGGINRDRLQEQWRVRISGVKPLPEPDVVPMGAKLLERCARTEVPSIPGSRLWQPVTESHAQRTLDGFLTERGFGYAGGISSPNTALRCGSRLSTHLTWGTLSIRQAYHATVDRLAEIDREPSPDAARWSRSLRNFLARLHWRDHFMQRLETEPEMEFQPLHPAYRALRYEDDPQLLSAWAEGRTGFPLVDAVMRCLAATGFVNFRMRAMVLSFACHALHLDWRVAHFPLCRTFRDYEPGVHFSQLQMQAGVVGFNTIRVYSPQKQLEEQDANGHFVREWIPELREHPTRAILGHHLDPVAGYTAPIVDFVTRTRRMKDLLFKIRATQSGAETQAVYAKHGSRRRPARRRVERYRPDQLRLF